MSTALPAFASALTSACLALWLANASLSPTSIAIAAWVSCVAVALLLLKPARAASVSEAEYAELVPPVAPADEAVSPADVRRAERLERWLALNEQVTTTLTSAAALLAERPEIVQAWPDVATLVTPAEEAAAQQAGLVAAAPVVEASV